MNIKKKTTRLKSIEFFFNLHLLKKTIFLILVKKNFNLF